MHTLKLADAMLFLSTLSLRRATSARPETRRRDAISIHALLAESDTTDMRQRLIEFRFLSTLSLRRATPPYNLMIQQPEFLSTLSLRRATREPTAFRTPHHNFYPRSPCGERHCTSIGRPKRLYFYPRSPCGERRQVKQTYRTEISISIHALLAESDLLRFSASEVVTISIHALLAESDHRFRSWLIPRNNFYPRSPCGERLLQKSYHLPLQLISIHALLAESDGKNWRKQSIHHKFLSTLSLRRATKSLFTSIVSSTDFYPRSPCGERHCTSIGRPKRLYFYPRSPCGERRHWSGISVVGCAFLSTLSLRRATATKSDQGASNQFLSTLSLRRATEPPRVIREPTTNFYPRSPCGERPPSIFRHCTTYLFLSTLSLRRATRREARESIGTLHFYPRSPCGERLISDAPSSAP